MRKHFPRTAGDHSPGWRIRCALGVRIQMEQGKQKFQGVGVKGQISEIGQQKKTDCQNERLSFTYIE